MGDFLFFVATYFCRRSTYKKQEMKHKLMLLSIFGLVLNFYAQNINFSDPIFKQFILQGTRIDADKNGEISTQEAAAVNDMYILHAPITNASDLQFFPNLKSLVIQVTSLTSIDLSNNTTLETLEINYNNSLTSIDLSNNVLLKNAYIHENNLASIDVSNNTELTNLKINRNKLTTLDVSNNLKLKELDASENLITSLNLPANNILENIILYSNAITTIDLSNSPLVKRVLLSNNQITSLNTTSNIDLESLVINDNLISTLDLSLNTKLNTLSLENNKLTSIDISNNSNIKYLSIGGNLISSLDLRKFNISILSFDNNPNLTHVFLAGANTFQGDFKYVTFKDCPNLINLCVSPQFKQAAEERKTETGYFNYDVGNCGDDINFTDSVFKTAVLNQDQVIDIDGNGEVSLSEATLVSKLSFVGKGIQDMSEIKYFTNLKELTIHESGLTSLNLDDNILLENLHVHSNLSIINLEKNTKLKSLYINNEELTNIDLSTNTALTEIRFLTKKLATLDLQNNVLLERFTLHYDDQITAIDFSNNINLNYVSLRDNPELASINVTNNTNLDHLIIYTSKISNIDVTNNTELTYLGVLDTDISSLNVSNNLKLKDLVINAPLLTSIDISNNTALETFDLAASQVTNIDLSNNTLLKTAFLNNNKLTNIDISNNTLLDRFYISNNEITSIDFTNNTNLRELEIRSNKIKELDVRNCSLEVLNFDGNEDLTKAYLSNQLFGNNFDNVSYLFCPNLESICIDTQFVNLAKERRNLSDYSDYKVTTNCDSNFISGQIRFDIDKNGCDTNDRGFASGLRFNIFPLTGGIPVTVFPDENGFYEVEVGSGTYIMLANFDRPSDFQLSPELIFQPGNPNSQIPINFPANGPVVTKDFCVKSLVDFNDLEITMIPDGDPARPGFDASYTITYTNRGTTTQSGTISLDYTENILTLVSANPVVETTTTDNFVWSFTDLKPYESREIQITLNVNTPTASPAVNDGDILDYTATITGGVDESPEDNTMNLKQTVVNSFDPNDKTCLEGNQLDPDDVGQYLHYLIRFENLGTASAINVRIEDEIDINVFDLTTLEPLQASHPFVTTITDTTVQFIFEDINLPFDDANNDGYVLFKIKTLDTLVEGDNIDNKAGIYFDFNHPVITNTERVEVKKEVQIPTTFDDFFTLYPNPTSGVVNLTQKITDVQIQYISVHDLSDRMVGFFFGYVPTFDIGYLFPNVYVIKIHTDKGILTKKFVKTN